MCGEGVTGIVLIPIMLENLMKNKFQKNCNYFNTKSQISFRDWIKSLIVQFSARVETSLNTRNNKSREERVALISRLGLRLVSRTAGLVRFERTIVGAMCTFPFAQYIPLTWLVSVAKGNLNPQHLAYINSLVLSDNHLHQRLMTSTLKRQQNKLSVA